MVKFCTLQVRFNTEPASRYMMESSWEVMVGGSAHRGVEHKTNHGFLRGVASLPEGYVFSAAVCKIQASKRHVQFYH